MKWFNALETLKKIMLFDVCDLNFDLLTLVVKLDLDIVMIYLLGKHEIKAVSKPLLTVTATVTVRSANFRSASIWLRLASIREDQLQ